MESSHGHELDLDAPMDQQVLTMQCLLTDFVIAMGKLESEEPHSGECGCSQIAVPFSVALTASHGIKFEPCPSLREALDDLIMKMNVEPDAIRTLAALAGLKMVAEMGAETLQRIVPTLIRIEESER